MPTSQSYGHTMPSSTPLRAIDRSRPSTLAVRHFYIERFAHSINIIIAGQLAPSRQITAMGFDAMLGQEVATMGPANLRLVLVRLPVLTARSKVLTTLRLVGNRNCGNMLHQLLRTAIESSVSLTKLSLSGSDLSSPKHSVRIACFITIANASPLQPLKKLATYSIFKALTRRSSLITDLDLAGT